MSSPRKARTKRGLGGGASTNSGSENFAADSSLMNRLSVHNRRALPRIEQRPQALERSVLSNPDRPVISSQRRRDFRALQPTKLQLDDSLVLVRELRDRASQSRGVIVRHCLFVWKKSARRVPIGSLERGLRMS